MVGKVKNVTISQSGKHWFVSLQVEQEMGQSIHPSASMVAGDMGVKRLLTLSNGQHFEPIDVARYTAKTKRLQRKLAKKVKFSNNWKKIKQKISELHNKIARIRHDRLHKISTLLSKATLSLCLKI